MALWNPDAVVEDFRVVAGLAKIVLPASAIAIETLDAPHTPPSRLPFGKMAIYVFSYENIILKVGKVGPNSQARYVNQHYIAGSASSTLAGSILSDREWTSSKKIDAQSVGAWIRTNTDRVNVLLDIVAGYSTLSLLEAFLHSRLRPRYEGFVSQRDF